MKGGRRIVGGVLGFLALLACGYVGTRFAEPAGHVSAIDPVFAERPEEALPVLNTAVSIPAAPAPPSPQVSSEGPPDSIDIIVDGDRELYLPLESVFVLPDDSVAIRVMGAAPREMVLSAEGGTVEDLGRGAWSWDPEFVDGYADLVMTHRASNRVFMLRAWRLVPRSHIRDGTIGTYRVGRYPATPLSGNPIYLPPPGLVEVTRANRDVRVSPRFRIGHFVSKQSASLPSYLILRTQLLLKLEVLLDALIERGYPAPSFHVMSGYRTPYYNVSVLGNAEYSRHQWGGAADIFIDERPKNGYMDDLNGNGSIGLDDIQLITELVDSLEAELASFPIGGAGVYGANTVRGPFVHVDVRGQRARW